MGGGGGVNRDLTVHFIVPSSRQEILFLCLFGQSSAYMDSLAQLEDAANSGSETTYLKRNWTDEYLGKLSL